MTKIGDVQSVQPYGDKWIVLIKIDSIKDLRVKNGDVILLQNCGEVMISGMKLWPEHSTMDILINKGDRIPAPGESAYVP